MQLLPVAGSGRRSSGALRFSQRSTPPWRIEHSIPKWCMVHQARVHHIVPESIPGRGVRATNTTRDSVLTPNSLIVASNCAAEGHIHGSSASS